MPGTWAEKVTSLPLTGAADINSKNFRCNFVYDLIITNISNYKYE